MSSEIIWQKDGQIIETDENSNEETALISENELAM
jgi:hypothetical protein